MHLSRLQIVAIALTIAWVIGATYSGYEKRQTHARTIGELTYQACKESASRNEKQGYKSCEQKRDDEIVLWSQDALRTPLMIAVALVPFGWFAGAIVVYGYRIFRSGYSTIVHWQTLSRVKKTFVVLMLSGTSVAIFFTLVALMATSINLQVPVTPGFKSQVLVLPSSVWAEGTWTVVGGKIDPPLQTSKIKCYREEKQCYEAKATVNTAYGSFLNVDVSRYEIVSWTSTNIVYVDRNNCFNDIYTIDLVSKTVNGITRVSPDAAKNKCKVTESSDDITKRYRLADGFDVHQALRKEAEPWLLRVIASLFGAR